RQPRRRPALPGARPEGRRHAPARAPAARPARRRAARARRGEGVTMAEATVLAQPEAASAPTAARADVSRPARVERRTTAPRRVAAGAGALLRRPALALSLAVLALVALAAVAPHVLAPGDPLAAVPDDKLRAPSAEHLFCTDQLGRDVLSRVVHGTRLSLSAAGLAVALGVSVGAGLGLVAGYVGGRLDAALMRVCDVLLAVPAILLSLAVVAALGFGTLNVAIAVGVDRKSVV